MLIHKFVIGIRFNENMFRLASFGGLLMDEILRLRSKETKINEKYFTKISSVNNSEDLFASFLDENGINNLTIFKDQVVFKKSSKDPKVSVNLEKTIEEFEIFWKVIDKVLVVPDTRRIGFVAEHRVSEKKHGSGTVELIDSLTKFEKPQFGGHFRLSFEDRRIPSDGTIPDPKVSDFINVIKNIYTSDQDLEDKEEGKLNFNVDVQRYFNPSIKNPIKEFRTIKSIFEKERKSFIAALEKLGVQ